MKYTDMAEKVKNNVAFVCLSGIYLRKTAITY